MSDAFFKSRARTSIFGLFFCLADRQIRDSRMAYQCIFTLSVAYVVFGWVSLTWNPKIFFIVTNAMLTQSTDFFAMFPPFLLTVVVIFPAFSEGSKAKLRELNKNGEPKVAPFLDQFVFLLMLSLFLMFVSKLYISANLFSEQLAPSSDACFWLVSSGTFFISLLLSLTWEILDSIKNLYVLILREYF